MTRRGIAAAVAVASTLTAAGARTAPAQDASTAALGERAGRYVEAYEQAFAAIVCVERQMQSITALDAAQIVKSHHS
jgi:hypothetical protein